MTTKTEIREWLERGREKGATHMIVACDTFDWEDYPVFVEPGDDARKIAEQHEKVMEVYRLDMDWAEQLSAARAFNY